MHVVPKKIDPKVKGHRDPGLDFLRGGTRPPQSLIVAFIDECRQAGHAASPSRAARSPHGPTDCGIDECRRAGHAVESICRVLTQQGCYVALGT
jgi:hypothetical protein